MSAWQHRKQRLVRMPEEATHGGTVAKDLRMNHLEFLDEIKETFSLVQHPGGDRSPST